MSDDGRLSHLIDELLSSHATPEEVCASCPELLPQVRARWQKMCRLRADLDALFPPLPTQGGGPPAGDRIAQKSAAALLPQAPGAGGWTSLAGAWGLRQGTFI